LKEKKKKYLISHVKQLSWQTNWFAGFLL